MMGMVGTPGLEPGRPIKPTDFKSVVFTNFTMPPKKSNWLAVSLGFVLQRNCHAGKEIKTPIMLASCQKGELP